MIWLFIILGLQTVLLIWALRRAIHWKNKARREERERLLVLTRFTRLRDVYYEEVRKKAEEFAETRKRGRKESLDRNASCL